MDFDKENVNVKLLELMQKTGYPISQENGQRKFGPPSDWTGPPPPKGSEVFIGKLPREVFEDELVPIFSSVGKIYELRLMMDFSGSNRGYAFVLYTCPQDAFNAIKNLNNYEIRPARRLGVVKSVDNCRLFLGNIPRDKTKEELVSELSQRVSNIVSVILYQNAYDRSQNRGFAFVEFTSHRAAAMARRTLVPGYLKLWDQIMQVDWAEPEPEVDEERMQKVTVLYVRNLLIQTQPAKIQSIFEATVKQKILRVKKIYDYAFVHFMDRDHAELAMNKLQNAEIDGSIIEIRWAKPVDRELYHIQKSKKGNSKFNSSLNFSQTLMLYKQHLEKNSNSSNEEDASSSSCADPVCRLTAFSSTLSSSYVQEVQYPLAPAKLESLCKRYMWGTPIYEFQKYIDPLNVEVWVGSVELPYVGMPLLQTPRNIGPLSSVCCYSVDQAHTEAAELALRFIKLLRGNKVSPVPFQPTVLATSPNVPVIGFPYTSQQLYPHLTPVPMPVPQWR